MDDDKRPVCKRCGLPARYVVGRASVRVRLNVDGGLGDVERVSNTMVFEARVYVDGQNHRFNEQGDSV